MCFLMLYSTVEEFKCPLDQVNQLNQQLNQLSYSLKLVSLSQSSSGTECLHDKNQKYYDLLDGKSSSVVGSVGNNNVERLIAMYNGNARISWNGNPIPSSDLATFLFNLPKSIHQVQAFDSHPISGNFLLCFLLFSLRAFLTLN